MNTNISDDKLLKIIIEVLKVKIHAVATEHQLTWNEAKDLVLSDLYEKITG